MSDRKILIGVDASNILAGGGLRHLVELIRHSGKYINQRAEIVVWAPKSTVKEYSLPSGVRVIGVPEFEINLYRRFLWRQQFMKPFIRKYCDVLFVPGGIGLSVAVPQITMSQNMQPFDRAERRREGVGRKRWRLEILRWLQSRSFERSESVIFLSKYAQEEVCRKLRRTPNYKIIPHGVDSQFHSAGVSRDYSSGFRVLYVSSVNKYKNQVQVVQACAALRNQGLSFKLELVGRGAGAYHSSVISEIKKANNSAGNEFIAYVGEKDFSKLPGIYESSDIFVFASSCENLPNILIEAMAARLPIACASVRPMTDVLGSAGVYFDPLRPSEIASTLEKLINDAELRAQCGRDAGLLAQRYSWDVCAKDTIELLINTAQNGLSTEARV